MMLHAFSCTFVENLGVLQEAFLGEGSEEDYIIQGGDLFGDDFKFNLYGVAQPAKKAVSRRHLREGLGSQWLSMGQFGF